MVRATVRAVSKRKILPTRAALTLVSYELLTHFVLLYALCKFGKDGVNATGFHMAHNVMLRDPKLASQMLANRL